MTRTPRLLACLLLATAWFLPTAQAEEASAPLPRAAPAEVGLSAERLAAIDDAVAKHIEKKDIAGALTVVARKGKVAYFKSFGSFKDDSILRIYSMSKPIAVAAALILIDEGKLKLDDPVSKYIPGIAEVAVEGTTTKPAPMTVQHLMQHTAGLSYGIFGNTPVDRRYRDLRMLDKSSDLEAFALKICKAPLLYAPGSRWHYSVSIDLLGRVVEVAAKQPFDVFLQKRLFAPLGMVDTAFFVPEAKAKRLVPNYAMQQYIFERPETSPFLKKPALCSGGGGLVSTASDYTRFALMLAAGGIWNGKRILSAKSVHAMTTNQLPEALVPIAFGKKPWPGVGFGLGVSVRVKHESRSTKIGEWGWGGAASTTFFVAPKQELVVVTMTQRMPMWRGLDNTIRPLAYGALLTETTTPAASKPAEKKRQPVGAGK